jgi:hypothetical protein
MSAQMWSCPNPECPPSANAPKQIPIVEQLSQVGEAPLEHFRPWQPPSAVVRRLCGGECGNAYRLIEFTRFMDQ